jgi:hypothetical protein
MSSPTVWSVLSDLTKLLDLHRNKHVGIKQLLKSDEESIGGDTRDHINKKSFNYTIIEYVQLCLEYLTSNLKPSEDLKQSIEQYLVECESISNYSNILQLIGHFKIFKKFVTNPNISDPVPRTISLGPNNIIM